MRHLVFLPGAGGAAAFWEPVGAHLPRSWEKAFFSWPGLGDQPHDHSVRGFDDLVRRLEPALGDTTDLIAQSLGGVVAIRLALTHPDRVRRLVLVSTSGGVDVAQLGGTDWREDYRREYPSAADWITADLPDHTHDLTTIGVPTLLLWGDDDPISPIAVGRHLQSLLADSSLEILRGGTHAMALERPSEVAALIETHLR